MKEHRQVLTPKQKENKKVYMNKYAKENVEKLSEYQHERWLRDKEKIIVRKRKKNIENPEIRKNQSKDYYEKNRESILEAVKDYRVKNIDSVRATARKYTKTPKGILMRYKSSARERGYDFSLSTNEFNELLFANCHYCGEETANGVDRKDSNIGYYSYNVVPCCKICNYMKGTNSYSDFINHIALILENLSQ